MNERWKPIPEAPGYQISSRGNLRNPQGLVMRTFYSSGGMTANVQIGRVPTQVRIARLVGAAFQRAYRPELYPSYRNGDLTDCRVCNVRWGPRQSVAKSPFTRSERKAGA